MEKRFENIIGMQWWEKNRLFRKQGLIKDEWQILKNKVHEKIKAVYYKYGVPFKCQWRNNVYTPCSVCQDQNSVKYPNKALKKK